MNVHRTNEDYLSDMVFSSAYGPEYMYTPNGMAMRKGYAANPQPSSPRAKIPTGQVGTVGKVTADIPTAYAVNTVKRADLGFNQKPVSKSVKDAASVAQSRLQAYVKKVRTGR